MPPLPQLARIETNGDFGTRIAETFRVLSNHLDNIEAQAGVTGRVLKSPPTIRQVMLQANSGAHELAIVDPEGAAAPSLGIHYFADFDVSPAFANPHTIHLGPSRNHFINLGALPVYWRVYSQYRNSPKSAYVMAGGSNAMALNAFGSATVAPLPSQGSGGSGGRGGFGGS